MPLKLHNTLTRKTEEFKPLNDGEVKLYTCGPTVYSTPLIGNWVAYIYWDTLVRLLEIDGFKVTRVMNITDVGHLVSDADSGEDKMQKSANKEGKTAWEVAEFYTKTFMDGMQKLNLKTPTIISKATDYIPNQIELVRKLQAKNYTYQIDDGIYFDTSKFPTYADFARLNIDDLKAGARVEYNSQKRNSSDFALWKFTPDGEKRDMEWEFDGRMGFPGWHIECSAMAQALLGDTIDIHTGGIDHIAVHHTNEIAQSEAATGQKFCNYWIHNNHIKVDGTKISKSLGNGYTLDQLIERGYSPFDFKMLVLQSHYSHEGNFTFDNLTAAKNRLNGWRNIAALRHQTHDTLISDNKKHLENNKLSLSSVPKSIIDAMNNDLATPEAFKIIDETFAKISSQKNKDIDQEGLVQLIEFIDSMFGLNLISSTPDIDDESKQLIVERNNARLSKDWARSDEIRDILSKKGIVLRDSFNETVWEYKE